MLKKIIATCITVVILCSLFLGVIPVSAATGTDISETFEFYGSMDGVDPSDLVRTFWVTSGCLANKNSIDETKSAPNRGDGKGAGNYRSMKIDVKFFSGPDGTWGTFRFNTHEDWAAVKDGIERMDKSLAFSFWADVEKEMVLESGIDINNVPYDKDITLTPGWKKYTLKLDELEPQTDKYGDGTGIFEVQEMVQKGEGGWKYPFFCGFKFGVKADWQEVQENTIWIDTIAIEGDTITERTEYKVEVGDTIYPTEFDENGPVPKNFVPDNSSSNKNENTPSSKKDNTTSSKKDTTTSSKKDTTTSKKDNAGVVSSKKDNTASSNDSSNISSTTSDNSNVQDANTSDVIDSSKPTEDNKDNQDSTNTQSKPKDSKVSIGIIIAIVLGGLLIIAAIIVFIFAMNKKKMNIPANEDETEVTEVTEETEEKEQNL